MTAPIGSCAEKLRPTTASLEEHSDSKNASAIIESSGSKRPSLPVSGSFFVRLCMTGGDKRPRRKVFSHGKKLRLRVAQVAQQRPTPALCRLTAAAACTQHPA